MSEGRRLVLMRHAKAEQVAATDHARPLTERGRTDATRAGRWAREAGVLPDHAFVSSATRAAETWERFRDGAGLDLDERREPAVYSAGTDAAIEILRTAPAGARTVLLVGHNPTMSQLVHLLDDGTAESQVYDELSAGLPTCAVAVLDVPGEWADLDVGGARLIAFHVGRR